MTTGTGQPRGEAIATNGRLEIGLAPSRSSLPFGDFGGFSSRPQTLLQPTQTRVGEQGQRRRRNRPRQNELIVHHRQSSKNEFSQSTGANGCSDRRQSHRDHHRHPHSRENHTHRQRQLHLKKKLTIGEPHAAARFHHRRIHSPNSRERIPNQRQQRIQSQSQNCQTVSSLAQPGQRQQKTKQCQARDRLNNV